MTGDITYIRTSQGWLYLTIVLDLHSRRVLSWAFSSQPNSELSTRALQLAVQHRQPEQPLLFDTDQGVQYSSDQFQRSFRMHGITASMSRRGNCLDNAFTERFFRSLKQKGLTQDNIKPDKRQWKTLLILLSRSKIASGGIQLWAIYRQQPTRKSINKHLNECPRSLDHYSLD